MAELEVEITGDISDLNRKLNQTQRKLSETGKSFNTLNEFAVGALSGIAAAFSIGAIVNFGKAVLDTTAKFQKFEAVLSNTLGSESKAQQALIQIQQFASQTPFAVDELTSAFVKLANQGFRPTVNELRSLGDLAASTGKSFDQLAEAIIDAQVGEFERLKEFGVRAKVQGDLVTFTFKGVETQVQNTSDAIRGYVLSLGEAEGVSGSMAKISETLGGKISNLGDNIEQLKLAIGDQTSGLFATSINWLNEFISLATLAVKSVSDIRKEVMMAGDAELFSETRKEVDFLIKRLSETLPVQDAINRAVELTKQSYQDLGNDISKGFITGGLLSKQLRELEEYRLELLKTSETSDIVKLSFEDFSKAQAKVNKSFFESGSLIELEIFNLQNLKKIADDVAATYDKLGQSILKSMSTPAIVDVGINIGQAPVIEIPDFDDSKATAFLLKLKDFKDQVVVILSDQVANTIGDFAFAIGDALASGGNVLEAAGAALLGGIASILNQLGQLAIATGIAIGGIKKALLTLNPVVAIAAGTALVALAGFVSSKARSLGGFGGGTGGGVGGSVAQSQTFGGTGAFTNPNDFLSNVVFEIEGTRLVGVLQRTQDKYASG